MTPAGSTQASRQGGHASDLVAIVGAGLAGVAAAQTLQGAGQHVRVFDKARGVSGRMSTRRTPQFEFDHGAQYFTVRDPRFERAVSEARAAGAVAEWRPRVARIGRAPHSPEASGGRESEPWYVGTPGMNSLAKFACTGLDVQVQTRVQAARWTGAGWALDSETGPLGTYRRLIVSVPAPQAAPLLREAPELAARVGAESFDPCYAVLVGFDSPVVAEFDAAFVDDGTLTWVARNSSKPGRSAGEAWVLHATPQWTGAHFIEDESWVVDRLLRAFQALIGATLPRVRFARGHRWRYARRRKCAGARPSAANSSAPNSSTHGEDAPIWGEHARGLAIAGDACTGARVEDAWLSGWRAAQLLLQGERDVSVHS